MKPDRKFLDEVFSEDSDFQAALLGNTLRYARKRKRRRNRMPTAAILVVVSCLALLPILFRGERRPSETRQAAVSPVTEEPDVLPGTNIRLVNDEELLSLFSGRPVAFIGEGDQRRFVVLDAFRTRK